ncbi:MAG: hypothetical protein NC218_05705 [Acetobacter sp.]|nr:hypothetical protein [Acetobacter sp.]
MTFNFFTFGGAVFWEDVFFYQKWRIQRHCFTKSYRLLDSWDIRRASGSFKTCQKAFVKYINSYELVKQQGKMIILLHGYMDSKNIFKKLWRKFILIDSTVAALNYPSLFQNSRESAYQLLFFLNHIDNIDEVSFVTKGAGNLVLQKTLNLPLEQQIYREKMKIGNIVEINPVIKGNIFCDYLLQFKLFRFLNKTMLGDMTEQKIKLMPNLPPHLNYLKIFCDSKFFQYFSTLIKVFHFPIDTKSFNNKRIIHIKDTPLFPIENEEILNKTVNFIKNGKI